MKQQILNQNLIITTNSNTETFKVGYRLGKIILELKFDKVIVGLDGDLGSGKTVFVNGLAKGLKISDQILSPSFTIVKEYKFNDYLFCHIDLYRLANISDLVTFDFYEYIKTPKVILAIEWISKFNTLDYIQNIHLILININIENKNMRKIKFSFVNIDSKIRSSILKKIK